MYWHWDATTTPSFTVPMTTNEMDSMCLGDGFHVSINVLTRTTLVQAPSSYIQIPELGYCFLSFQTILHISWISPLKYFCPQLKYCPTKSQKETESAEQLMM
jgi:hypothetical protein